MGGGGTFGAKIMPQRIKNPIQMQEMKKVLSVFLNKHRDFEARHDLNHVRKASHSGVYIFSLDWNITITIQTANIYPCIRH